MKLVMKMSISVISQNRTLDFVRRVISEFDIGDSKTRVGLIYFSTDVYIHFYLNTYANKANLLRDITPEKIRWLDGFTNTQGMLILFYIG